MIQVNQRPLEWHEGITLADAVRFYTPFDSLITINPDLWMIVNNVDYSEKDPETVLLNDGDYVILMYEFYGG